MNISVIGAGNGGQAIAGYSAMAGHNVCLYDRCESKIKELQEKGEILLQGKITGRGKITSFSTDLRKAIRDAQLVMITTIANAHEEIAKEIAPCIQDGQIFVLNPGRTCGALAFQQALISNGCNIKVYVAEAQTLVYACRLISNGCVNIIGIKDEVLLSAVNKIDTPYILSVLSKLYQCFKPAEHVLRTSLENIGAVLHACVMLMNAGSIERKREFFFYRDMTQRIAAFIESVDAERIALGRAYGIDLLSVREWIKFAYKDTTGDTLCERMQNNPSYYSIKAPKSIFIRQLTEDIPTGILPMMELGKAAGLEMKLFESLVNIASCLLGVNFQEQGRTLDKLGLKGMSKDEIINHICK